MSKLLQHWIAQHAQRRPEAVALAMNQQRMTYGELEAASNQLAHLLKAAGCQKGDRVCFLIPKSPAAIVCILGILKADCIYVPIDPASPAARAAKIIAACENRWLLAAGAVTNLLEELTADEKIRGAVSIGWLDEQACGGKNFTAQFSQPDLSSQPATPPAYQNSRADAAYILFTSGSTGVPKGVVITHDNVIHFVEWAVKYFGMSPYDRVSGHSPLHFDLSVFDVFGAFAAGAQLHLVPPELNLLPNKLTGWIRRAELTQWFSVPSALNYMAKFDAVQFHDFPALQRLLWCGEVLPTPALAYFMKRLPHARFTNLYGPTETTIASSYYSVLQCPEDEKTAIPIGAGCAGEALHVLNEQLQPLPPNAIGDLYISGAGLSPGYWRDPEKTAAVFLQNPNSADPHDRLYKTGDLAKIGDDGLVYFLGRADSQIKSRGYRIELGEIETALHAMQDLQESAVVAINASGFEGAAICCAYVPIAGVEVNSPNLRKALAKVLPNYMMPARWLALERLPKNDNGKIDRPKLREQFQRYETHAH